MSSHHASRTQTHRWSIAIATLCLALWGCEQRNEGASAPPRATTDAASPAAAAVLFAHHCVICHGERGDGHGARRGSLYRKPPDFRSSLWRCEQSLSSVRKAIREGIPASDMPSWQRLGEAQIQGLADFVLALGGPC